MRSTKIIKICSSSLCTCLHHIVILRTRNKITDFLMILVWASPFKRENNLFFCDQRPTIFILCFVEEMKYLFFVVCFPYYVRYHLVFFSGQHIFHQFRQHSVHIFHKLFFLIFVATNYLFQFFLVPSPPPPPDIKWCDPK